MERNPKLLMLACDFGGNGDAGRDLAAQYIVHFSLDAAVLVDRKSIEGETHVICAVSMELLPVLHPKEIQAITDKYLGNVERPEMRQVIESRVQKALRDYELRFA